MQQKLEAEPDQSLAFVCHYARRTGFDINRGRVGADIGVL
jgi:hypothetical protein